VPEDLFQVFQLEQGRYEGHAVSIETSVGAKYVQMRMPSKEIATGGKGTKGKNRLKEFLSWPNTGRIIHKPEKRHWQEIINSDFTTIIAANSVQCLSRQLSNEAH